MQQLNCARFLLWLAILSATLGPFIAIAHRELMMVTNSASEPETRLELGTDKTNRVDETRSNVMIGRKMASGETVKDKKSTKDARSKPSSGEIKNYPTNSREPSSLKDSASSRMTAGSSMDSMKLDGSTSVLVLNIPKPQHTSTLPSKPSRNPSSGSKKELKDSIVHGTLYNINEDWKERMLEASDEVFRLLNKDYHASPHRRSPVHN